MVCATGCPKFPNIIIYLIIFLLFVWLQYPCILQLALYIYIYTTTCASRVSVLVGHRKKAPPVQVTVATTTCASRVSAPVGHRKRPPPVQVTVDTTTCVSRVSALVGHRKRPPVQVTVAPAPFAPPHVPESGMPLN